MKILLISGHGAGDSGAVGNGLKECDLTREFVNLLAYKLREYASVDVYNQSKNAFIDLSNGAFNVGEYDYALEVHFNSFNGSAKGTEIYVTDMEKAVTVEESIINNLSQFFVNRGVKKANFDVIYTLKKRGISSALLEVCFIDNKNDIEVYQSNKDRVVKAVCNGIVSGFGLNQNAKPQPTPQEKQVMNYVPNDFVRENATFTLTVNRLDIMQAPSLNAKGTDKWYEKGMSVVYDGYVKRDGFVWISWKSASSGVRRWMQCREISTNKPYGTFK